MTAQTPFTLTWTDYPDNHDCAVIVYFTGCGHDCLGCQNPELQDRSYGCEISTQEMISLIDGAAKSGKTDKVVFSGGDCSFQNNQEINKLISGLKALNYHICIYTGTEIAWCERYIPGADFYKCGRYNSSKKESAWGKDSRKMVFVSKNQRLYDKDFKQISVDNVYYFNRLDRIKAKFCKQWTKWFKRKRG